MLQAALASIILMVVYKFMKTNNEYEIEWYMAFVMVLVPVLMIFLLTLALGILGLPMELVLLGYLFYFFVPFMILKMGLDFEAKTAFKFAIVVPIAAIVAEIPFVLFFGAVNA